MFNTILSAVFMVLTLAVCFGSLVLFYFVTEMMVK